MTAFFLFRDEEVRQRKIQRRRLRDANNPFELLDQEFQHLYGINKDMGMYLIRQLESALALTSSHGVPVHVQVLSSVMFMAAGSYQRGVGQDHNLCVAQMTVSKYLSKVVAAINLRLKNTWIKFPGSKIERRSVASGFREKIGVPGILGAVDCTHVSIFPLPRPHGLQYINRKGKHTINVQLVTDVDCRVLHVNAEYPGRVHDSRIFRNSNVSAEMRRLYENRIGRYFLLGDSGYALEPWLMTPVLRAAPPSPEDRYTRWHCQARNVVERSNGYLKGSLRCLGIDRSLHYSPDCASRIIYACCTLYNMMKHYRVELREITEVNDEEVGESSSSDEPTLLQAAVARREEIINQHFN